MSQGADAAQDNKSNDGACHRPSGDTETHQPGLESQRPFKAEVGVSSEMQRMAGGSQPKWGFGTSQTVGTGMSAKHHTKLRPEHSVS